MKKKIKPIRCPYCGRTAVLRKSSAVYKNRAIEEYLYVCSNYPACDSYVGVHKGTMIPKGSLANGALRHRRIVAHRYFDSHFEQFKIFFFLLFRAYFMNSFFTI